MVLQCKPHSCGLYVDVAHTRKRDWACIVTMHPLLCLLPFPSTIQTSLSLLAPVDLGGHWLVRFFFMMSSRFTGLQIPASNALSQENNLLKVALRTVKMSTYLKWQLDGQVSSIVLSEYSKPGALWYALKPRPLQLSGGNGDGERECVFHLLKAVFFPP